MKAMVLLLMLAAAAAQAQVAPFGSKALQTPYREALSEEERLAGLALLWSEAKFNFANFDLVPTLDWDAEYLAAIPRVRAAKTTAEYYRALQELGVKLGDGHTAVYPPVELRPEWQAKPKVRTRLIDGRVFVVAVYDESTGVRVGQELVEIDGVPVMQYAAERVRPYMHASTPQDRDYRTYEQQLLSGSVSRPVMLTLRDDRGAITKREVPRYFPTHWPTPPLLEFRVLDGNVGHLRINSFNDEKIRAQFDELWDQIAKTSALILDVRENGGGNSAHAWYLYSSLTDKPFLTSRWKSRKYIPSYRAWKRAEEWHEGEPAERPPDGRRLYDKPVALLIGPRTFSAAEDFSVLFVSARRGPVVGEPTGGSTGQPLNIVLPGGGGAAICTKRDTFPDGREFVGVGVQPEVVVKQTVADLRAGRDVALAKAREVVLALSSPASSKPAARSAESPSRPSSSRSSD